MSEAITIPTLHCERCGHKWRPRVTDVKTCPSCRSPYWDTPKTRKTNPTEEKTDGNESTKSGS